MAVLRHVAFRCKDKEATRQFYEMIGFKFVGYRGGNSKGSVDLSDGTINITVIQYQGEERQPLEELSEFMHIGIIVDDLEAVYKKLLENGADLLRDDIKKRVLIDWDNPPTRSFKVADPDGNVVDITCAQNEWRGVAI
jgi:catechol 2,3-dioxygenase-like lactoylglutathione lyase family enzyme